MSAVSSCPFAMRRPARSARFWSADARRAPGRAPTSERLESVARRLRPARVRSGRARQQRAGGDRRGLRPVGEPAPAAAAEERVRRALVAVAALALALAVPSAFAVAPTIDARVDQANPRFGDSFALRRHGDGRRLARRQRPHRPTTSHRSRGSGRRWRRGRSSDGVAHITVTETIACLSAACLEGAGRGVALPRARVSAGGEVAVAPRRRSAGRFARRAPRPSKASRAGRSGGPTSPPSPTYRVSPSVAAACSPSSASVSSPSARSCSRLRSGDRAPTAPGDRVDQRERAVRLLRESATRDADRPQARREPGRRASSASPSWRATPPASRGRARSPGRPTRRRSPTVSSMPPADGRSGVGRPRSHSATAPRSSGGRRPGAAAPACACGRCDRGHGRVSRGRRSGSRRRRDRCCRRRPAASSSSMSRRASRPTRTRGSPPRSTGSIRSNGSYGLILFSDTAYQALPPNTPARELEPLLRFFDVPPETVAGGAAAGAAQPVDGCVQRRHPDLDRALARARRDPEGAAAAPGGATRQRPRRRQRRRRPRQPGRDRLSARGHSAARRRPQRRRRRTRRSSAGS